MDERSRISSGNTLFIYNENCFAGKWESPLSASRQIHVWDTLPRSAVASSGQNTERHVARRREKSSCRVINEAWPHFHNNNIASSSFLPKNNVPFYSLFHVINFYYTSFIFLSLRFLLLLHVTLALLHSLLPLRIFITLCITITILQPREIEIEQVHQRRGCSFFLKCVRKHHLLLKCFSTLNRTSTAPARVCGSDERAQHYHVDGPESFSLTALFFRVSHLHLL